MTDLPPPAPPPSRPPSPRRWALGAVPLAIGGFLGYQAAYSSSVGGFGGGMTAAFLVFAIGGLVVVAGLAGIMISLVPPWRGGWPGRYAFATAGLLALGGVGGGAAVPLLDLGYHDPVILQARGEATPTLTDVTGFEPNPAGRADCRSVADGTDVEGITALSLGKLHDGTLRGAIALPGNDTRSGSIEFWIDGADLPQGSGQPFWRAVAEIEAVEDGSTGRATFESAALEVNQEGGPPDEVWHVTLSGEVSWSCRAWFTPDASALPSTSARVQLKLEDRGWTAVTDDGSGTCDFEADGSVWTVSNEQAGTLREAPVSVAIDLSGAPQAGDRVIVTITVHLPSLGAGGLIPDPLARWSGIGTSLVAATSGRGIQWSDLATLTEIDNDGLRGRATFTLARDAAYEPDWPATLTGETGWECR